ncbi:hypothetical protein CI105_04005 [Candidatus Izimaplasma bacterium ZiA1]|uniref:LURP-one-related/scramblase family protein n=1 Tax=Candidatus Izimoplasma sp. ZiA1 TaxID=2024899 RepID=UPI000BAA7FF0|nr:hypothetical protein CI105_04005 [Candidatus Izimaplasma bacterium ZiA1]
MRFYIKQKVFSLKDKFTVKDFNGNDIYLLQGKMFSLHNKMQLMNIDGSTLLFAQKKLFRLFPEYIISNQHNEDLAIIKKKFGLRPKFDITVVNKALKVEGSLFQHSFDVMEDTTTVASIRKKVLSFGDSYEIEVYDEQHTELLLFLVIIIDQVIHEQKNRGN